MGLGTPWGCRRGWGQRQTWDLSGHWDYVEVGQQGRADYRLAVVRRQLKMCP